MLRSPAAVLLDFDGTLFDTQASLRAGVTAARKLAAEDTAVDEAQWISANTAAAGPIWAANARGWILGKVPTPELSTMIYERTLQLVGAPTGLAPQLADVHAEAARAAARVFDDANAFLAALSNARIPAGLITNGADTQRELIDALGITKLFGTIIVSGERATAKPDRTVFDLACTELEVAPADTWHVGDSLGDDIAGALGAGISAVWVNRTGRERREGDPCPTWTVESLDQLSPML